MSSLVPSPSFLSLALRTANDGKLDGAWGMISDSAINLAACTYRKQYGLRHSKEWPLSKLMAENPNATLLFCQNLHDDGQLTSSYGYDFMCMCTFGL